MPPTPGGGTTAPSANEAVDGTTAQVQTPAIGATAVRPRTATENTEGAGNNAARDQDRAVTTDPSEPVAPVVPRVVMNAVTAIAGVPAIVATRTHAAFQRNGRLTGARVKTLGRQPGRTSRHYPRTSRPPTSTPRSAETCVASTKPTPRLCPNISWRRCTSSTRTRNSRSLTVGPPRTEQVVSESSVRPSAFLHTVRLNGLNRSESSGPPGESQVAQVCSR